MAIQRVAGTIAWSLDGNAFTTGVMNSTTATALYVIVAHMNTQPAPTDSKGNAFSLVASAPQSQVPGALVQIYSSFGPVVGPSHSFTVGAPGSQCAVIVMAFRGTPTTQSFDRSSAADNGPAPGLTTITPGPVTPTATNELLLTAAITLDPATFSTIDEGFFAENNHAPSAFAMGLAAGYQIQTAIVPRSPTFTFTATTRAAAVIATFRDVNPTQPVARPGVTGAVVITSLVSRRVRIT
jgi:hypothetical protein